MLTNFTQLNVSTHAYRRLHEIWVWCRFAKIQAPSDQIYKLGKFYHVVLPVNETGLQKWELLHNRILQKRLTVSMQMGSVDITTQCLEQWVVSIITTLSTGTTCSNCLTGEDIQRGSERREIDEMRKQYIEEKRYTVVEMWEYEGWHLYNVDVSVRNTWWNHCHKISGRIVPYMTRLFLGKITSNTIHYVLGSEFIFR